ncbi:MAG: hypothetical protein A3B10_02040 [Candidatus Doudnabacteria bacterium RIFCSPLOWO2_01_FULL_44_21]|uniref:SIMPL domain-containing protein n=1 Tax=Candidatus Doudnabacteria bacterium RIFCSPLOWO2_01_FULL_44_21 TaxID=1817841 RepID=A0A1F5Q5F0_9BACT|nr:MAG: hypothetical protein A3B95_00150 [Candidatus Doudnabacteria bacterium RIFCSPHIGHO2_02_FULL_43_13b]OGE97356.1 MAG: hypothetical protein A3B10_02040 [Candidatus Doudnabacteria bacterium RIFCSPLOWO2_01_FULL_44_21]
MNTNESFVSKNYLNVIAVLVILFLGLAVLDKGSSVFKILANKKPDNTITMTAEGRVSSKPDLATTTVGVISRAQTAKLAQDDNNKKVSQILEAIKKLGVADADIVTSNFSIYPTLDYTNGRNDINGYEANQTLTIKIHNVDESAETLNQVLDSALTSGSNQLQGVYFSFEDPDGLKQEARKQAIEKAKQKAQELGDATGLRIGRIVSISEDSGYPPYPVPYALEGKGGGGDADVSVGSQDITVNVTLIFEIK